MEAQLVKQEAALEIARVFQAPVALVYQAWTDPAMMNGWFHPDAQMKSSCKVDLRIGGQYEIQMQPPEGGPYVVQGVYQEIIPEEKLVFTWRWRGSEWDEPMLVTVTFRALSAAETQLTLRHERFPNVEERDSHAEGWAGTFEQLATMLG